MNNGNRFALAINTSYNGTDYVEILSNEDFHVWARANGCRVRGTWNRRVQADDHASLYSHPRRGTARAFELTDARIEAIADSQGKDRHATAITFHKNRAMPVPGSKLDAIPGLRTWHGV